VVEDLYAYPLCGFHNPSCAVEVMERWSGYAVWVVARSRTPDQGLVFTKPDGEPVPKWYIQRLFKKACAKAGVGPYRLHDLRHTFNTNMSKAGVKDAVVMKLTGHKTLAMFLRYSHLDREQGEDAMQRLNVYLHGSGQSGEPKKEEQET
jgi:integrase